MIKNIFSVLITLVMICGLFSSAYAANNTPTNNGTIYVSLEGDDNNNGLTLETSKRTIQKALNTAPNGGTVYVKAGIYKENLVIREGVHLICENRENTIIDEKKKEATAYGFQTSLNLVLLQLKGSQ